MATHSNQLTRSKIIALLLAASSGAACSGSSHDDGAGGSGGASSTSHGASGNHADGTGGSSTSSAGGGGAHAGTGGTNAPGGSGGASSHSGSGGDNGSNGAGGTHANGSGGAGAADAGSGTGGSSGDAGAAPSADDVQAWVDDYAAAHPGQDGDINAKTPAEIAADPDAQRLLSLCGDGQRPIIPALAWEYGGGDHAWINPAMSALVYCVYIPVSPSSSHWQYDAGADHVTADVYVLFPDQNPCKDETGADQVAKCIGDSTNFEILVDTASLNDGADAGLSLSEATTELMLVLPDGMKVHLWDD